ncbi:hypothetical protein Q764_05880 [Flavobacterium suncheonense GH29-5 = DSM 17707]|uniref:RHS repeat-associated core domain-containing protein n=2 Tax=Flavobacterium suncheonense TaxID=350894 RepID=A0A0A2ME76_9FLAO|nr:hypothetical protein Q764_05880 [Flavobacterium suncheonense GH29-5 = DSM 17707]
MGEGNFEDYGMRMYNTRIGRFFNVDPLTKKFPELSPYQFSSNTPIWAIDLDGLEAYFSNEGVFQKWGDDKSKTAPVIIVETNQTLDLNVTEFLDRAHWIFGEGRGEFADDYAHTIQNIKDWGTWGQGYKKEADMYKSMTDGTYSGKDDFFSGNTGYTTYDDFANARVDLNNLNKLKKANVVIKAVIDQKTGKTKDETPNATQWLGYPNKLSKKQKEKGETETAADKSYKRTVNKYGKEKVLRRDGASSGRSHIFYDTRPAERVKQLEKKKQQKK